MSTPAVRLRPAGPSLTVARRPAGPVRRVPALRPATLPGPGSPSTAAEPAGARERPAAPARGGVTRAPLGAPLNELPATAVPLAKDAPVPPPAPGAKAASGPALPVVQRRAEGPAGAEGPHEGGAKAARGGTQDSPAAPDAGPHRPSARTGARARGGLGAPLPALPPSADLPAATAATATTATTSVSGPDGRPGPVWQDRGPHVSPAPSGADAPLLGTADVQRRLAAGSAGPSPAEPGPAHHGNGPATPLVTPSPATTEPRSPAPVVAAGEAGAAQATRRPGTASDGEPGTASGGEPGPGGRRQHRDPAAPVPLVVARSVSEGTSGASGAPPLGPPGPHPLPVTRSAAHPAMAAPRTLSLLAARPLSLNTRAPEGTAPPAARTGGRPVVAPRWPAAHTTPEPATPSPGAPAAPRGNPAPPAREPARPPRGPSAVAPATAPVQRAAAVRTGPHGPGADAGTRATTGTGTGTGTGTDTGTGAGARNTGSAAPVQRVPVVRPLPPLPRTPGPGAHAASTAVPARPLPVTAPQAPPLADRPPAAPVAAPAVAVPVVRRKSAGPGGVPGGTAAPVQRTGSGGGDRVPPGGPGAPVPASGRPRSASMSAATAASATKPPSATTPGSARSAARSAEPAQDPGLDLDDLARRLLDPVARLLRAELRRGRERMGRPHDGRR
ncbi:hypothetical protein AB0L04_17665 [Streptomyces glaucescens]|uniref:hypothetical protein n=1 Tax=Streptomyces glaucescens TaxID=1907 RepID=UPI00344D9552